MSESKVTQCRLLY